MGRHTRFSKFVNHGGEMGRFVIDPQRSHGHAELTGRDGTVPILVKRIESFLQI